MKNLTRRLFNKTLLAFSVAPLLTATRLAAQSLRASDPFCPDCNPEFLPKVEKGRVGHYSVDFGDYGRVQKVFLNGKDITTDCWSCIEGKDGMVDAYEKDSKSKPVCCLSCFPGLKRRIYYGKVEVVLKEKYECNAGRNSADASG